MKKHFTMIIALIAVTAILYSCGNNETAEQSSAERIISVKAEVLSRQDIKVIRTFTGSLEGEKQAEIYAKIAEAVQKVDVHEGQIVDANMILIYLDKTGPSSKYQQTYSQYKNVEKNYKKMEYLFNEGAVSESQYDAARTEFEVNKAAFDAAARLVEIRSPIAGQVTSLNVSTGDFVQVGQKLVTIATTSRLRVKFGVNSSDVVDFEEGSEIFISSDAASAKVTGKVISIASSANPSTRAFEIEALVDNEKGILKPGMFVRINYVQESLSDIIAIPRGAVLTLENQETAFVVKNGVAEKRHISLGPEVDGQVVILSGLEEGDTLVTLGQDYLDDQYKINITALNESAQ